MFRARFFEATAVALLLALAHPARPADDPLARTAFDKEIVLEMKDTDVVEVFRQLAVITDVPFVLEFESDSSLTLSFNARNMSVRTLLSSIAHTYELKYEDGGDHVVVRPTGNKPAPRPAARPVRVSSEPNSRPASYHLRFEVRIPGGPVLSTPDVSTGLNQVAEIKQGIESSSGQPYYLLFKVTPKQDLGDSLELLVETSVERKEGNRRTVTEERSNRMAPAKEKTTLFESPDHELVLVEWGLEPRTRTVVSKVAGSVYELKLEIRRACGGTLPLGTVAARIGEAATARRIVTAGAVHACITPPPAEFMAFELTPQGVIAEGLLLRVSAKVERRPGRGRSPIHSSGNHKTAGKGETVLYTSHAGNELVLKSWGVLEQATGRPR